MISLALAYLGQRKLTTALNVLLVALAVALLTLLLAASAQTVSRLQRQAQGVDLVVGAKGSPLQLILSSIYHLDQPTGNIPLSALDLLRRDPAVARAAPLALGDTFRGYRIVGTDESFFELQGARVAQGRMFEHAREAVIGSAVAAQTGAALGQRFLGSHGLGEGGEEHDEQPFEVVGILAPAGGVVDRLILTSVESVWDVHGIDHDHEAREGESAAEGPVLQERGGLAPELTAILVTYRNAAAAIRLPSMINRQTAMQAASPAVETGRLLALFGASVAAAEAFGWALAGIGGLAIFVALFSATQARAADLALLRVMGATRAWVSGAMVLEAFGIAVMGVAIGVAAAHGALFVGVTRFAALRDIGIDPLQLHPGVGAIAIGTLVIATVAALFPAWRVYRTDIVRTLATGS